MKNTKFLETGSGTGYYGLLILLGAFILAGLSSFFYMEHNGHWVTGMTNQIVWGAPHVFAIFLIVAASGALNIASIGTVFGKQMYQPLGRMSALLAIALLIGGLTVLVLDLGRPDRLIVAMTHYNFKSIFAWNIILYNGFIALVALYIWTMLDPNPAVKQFYKLAGFAAFVWRLILTTGTGSIFGWLVARQAYDAAVLAPMFIVMSFSFGLAVFILVMFATYTWTGRPLGDAVVRRLKNLLGVFIAGVLYFVAVHHLTNLYATKLHGIESFFLRDGGGFTQAFWIGQIIIGSLLPLGLLYCRMTRNSRVWIGIASALVIFGGFVQLYVLLIGGQAYPLTLFPGYEVSSSFADGVINSYSPSLPELVLGVSGIAVAMAMMTVGMRVLRLAPVSLADEVIDPHHSK